MPVTLTANWKETISKELHDQIEEYTEYEYDLDDVLKFIDTHTEENFNWFEEYMKEVRNISADDPELAVDEYIEDVGGICYVERCSDNFMGEYTDGADYAREYDDYENPDKRWLYDGAIDYDSMWDNMENNGWMITDSGYIFREEY
tara:strand:- start:333 stop:770 length:438 start_codon:yes stop_codon:yes gene_type:complete